MSSLRFAHLALKGLSDCRPGNITQLNPRMFALTDRAPTQCRVSVELLNRLPIGRLGDFSLGINRAPVHHSPAVGTVPHDSFSAWCLGFEANLHTRRVGYHLTGDTGWDIDAVPNRKLELLWPLTRKPDLSRSSQVNQRLILVADQKERLRDRIPTEMWHRIDAGRQGREIIERPPELLSRLKELDHASAFHNRPPLPVAPGPLLACCPGAVGNRNLLSVASPADLLGRKGLLHLTALGTRPR